MVTTAIQVKAKTGTNAWFKYGDQVFDYVRKDTTAKGLVHLSYWRNGFKQSVTVPEIEVEIAY